MSFALLVLLSEFLSGWHGLGCVLGFLCIVAAQGVGVGIGARGWVTAGRQCSG